MQLTLNRFALVLFLVCPVLFHQSVSTWAQTPGASPAQLLQRAKSESDPSRRVRMLEEALQDQTLKGELLSALFLERGMAHKELKDCPKAIEDFNQAAAHSRKSFHSLIDKADCLIQLDQLDEAARVLELYLLSRPESSRAYIFRGLVYEKEGFLTRAEDEYTRAFHYDPQSIAALEMRARVVLKEGRTRKALEDLDEILRMDPRRAEAFMTRARVHVKLKNYDAALVDYGRAEALNPADDRVRKEKVLVHFKTGHPQRALEALSRPTSHAREDVEVPVLQARAHILLNNFTQAENLLKQVLKKDPHNASAHLYMGVVQMRRQNQDAALANLNRAIELDPTLVEAYKERARAFLEMDEPVRAGNDLTAAGNLDPADGEIFALRGLTYMKRMLYDSAISDFNRALEILPGDPRILYDRAVAYLIKDESQPALADLDAVLKMRPDAARALCLRGLAHFSQGNVTRAREDFNKAATIGPLDPQVWNNRGFFFYKIGDKKAAIDDFNRALQLDAGYESARYNLDLAAAGNTDEK